MITKKSLLLIAFIFLSISMQLSGENSSTAETESGAAPDSVKVDETTLTVDTAANQEPVFNQNISTFSLWDVARMVLVLGGVLGVIYLLFHLLKKISRPVRDTGSLIDIISTKNLSNNGTVHLIKIGGQVFLVGAGDGNVRLVSEITDKETLDQITLDNFSPQEEKRSFSDIIKGVLKGGTLKNIDRDRHNFLKQQKDRLKNM